MISKTIHYCWFSGEKYPSKIQHCIDSWKKYCPDFTLRKWAMADIQPLMTIPFVREAVQKQKWAFAADYVRLYALYTEGGIYLDSDVEVFSELSPFLDAPAFMATEAWGTHANPEAGIMASEKEQPFLMDIMRHYSKRHFISVLGALDLTPAPVILDKYLKKYGYQSVDVEQTLSNGLKIYPSDIFTNTCNIKENVVAIHRFTHSWIEAGRSFEICKKLHIMPVYYWYRGIKIPLVNFIRKRRKNG